MTEPRTIIFDLDGTLVDSFPGIQLGLNRALAELDIPPLDLDWVRRHVGRGAKRLLGDAAGDAVDSEKLYSRFRHHYSEVLLDNTLPYPGVDQALEVLADRHGLAVASNKPLHWVEQLVEHLGWAPIVSAVVGPESASAHKPDPAMVHLVLERVGGTADSSLLVGDMPVDVETGTRAGIPVVGVATGSCPPRELLDLGCVAVLDGVPDLPPWITRQSSWPPTSRPSS